MNTEFSPSEPTFEDGTANHSVSPDPPSPPPNAVAPALPSTALLTVEDVQRYLKRSRASVYRYANTDVQLLNPPYDAEKLNPEVRTDKEAPLMFHPTEVRRFARDVLGLNPIIEVQTPEETLTHQLLRDILQELKTIHQLLQSRP